MDRLERKREVPVSGQEFVLTPQHQFALTKHFNGIRREFGIDISPEQASHTASLLGRHEGVISQYTSIQYQAVTYKARGLAPGARIAEWACIDGREPRGLQDGRVISRSSEPGGIPSTTNSFGRERLTSGRLKDSIVRTAQSGMALVEYLRLHSAGHAPFEHGCAALKQFYSSLYGTLPVDINLVEFGIKLLKGKERVINDLFNAARLDAGFPALEKVTAIGVSDTDTMGFTLVGNDEEETLDTVQLAYELFGDISPILEREYGARYRQVGFMRNTFTKPEQIVPFEEANYNIAQTLVAHRPFADRVERYINNSNLSRFSGQQREGFIYTLARNTANLYLTGLHLEQHSPNHEHSHHRERYGDVSLEGVHVGQFDPEWQVLKSSPGNIADAVEQIKIQLAVVKGNGLRMPHTLFVTTGVPDNVIQSGEGLSSSRANNYNFYFGLLHHPQLQPYITAGELSPVPILMNEETREIVEIPNHLL